MAKVFTEFSVFTTVVEPSTMLLEQFETKVQLRVKMLEKSLKVFRQTDKFSADELSSNRTPLSLSIEVEQMDFTLKLHGQRFYGYCIVSRWERHNYLKYTAHESVHEDNGIIRKGIPNSENTRFKWHSFPIEGIQFQYPSVSEKLHKKHTKEKKQGAKRSSRPLQSVFGDIHSSLNWVLMRLKETLLWCLRLPRSNLPGVSLARRREDFLFHHH
ncbi:hypothetical protein CEXT_548741 [Caerostris extrusa]|uniref:Uncharacterized protein n=1 Tax=Caerostris extrusa TaxID=172846 RepID=A0AAV4TMQ0_CAEEX|nr:hypothetical protein CEXT_548741 [Caerostris extrusa]